MRNISKLTSPLSFRTDIQFIKVRHYAVLQMKSAENITPFVWELINFIWKMSDKSCFRYVKQACRFVKACCGWSHFEVAELIIDVI